jgi:C-terminal processing protease CtpA/Prc
VNLIFAVVIFTSLFLIASERNTNVIGTVVAGSPAASAHLQKGDAILRVAGRRVDPKDIPAHIRATEGKPFDIVVRRHGNRVVIGPLRAKQDHGAHGTG